MFGNKKEAEKEKDYVPCATCKHLILKGSANMVECLNSYGGEQYYCPEHKKNYDSFYYPAYPDGKFCYYRNMRVDENGTPIGYKKIDKNKIANA